jgi:ABC-2 type transport system permease protein
MARKEWQVMRRYWVNMLLLMATAVLVPLGYWAQAAGFAGGDRGAFDEFTSRSGTSDVAGFIYLGWAVYLWVSQMIWGPGLALRAERMQGSLEMIFLSPVSRLTILFGPTIAQLVPTALIFTVVGVMLRLVFRVPVGLNQLLEGLVVIVASIPALFAVGALMAVAVLRFRDAEGISAAIRGVLGVLCGITYPVAVLPAWVQPISRSLPPTQVLDALRGAMLRPAGLSGLWARVATLIALGAALGAVTMLLMERTVRSAQRSGRLGLY